jgi:hypothetical protein
MPTTFRRGNLACPGNNRHPRNVTPSAHR